MSHDLAFTAEFAGEYVSRGVYLYFLLFGSASTKFILCCIFAVKDLSGAIEFLKSDYLSVIVVIGIVRECAPLIVFCCVLQWRLFTWLT